MVGPALDPRTELWPPMLPRRDVLILEEFWESGVSGTTRRRVSGMVCDVVGVSCVKLDLREDRPRRLRLLTLVVKSLELIDNQPRTRVVTFGIAYLVLRGTWWDMSRRFIEISGGAAAVSSSESQSPSALLERDARGGLVPFMPRSLCMAAKSITSGSLIGPPASP